MVHAPHNGRPDQEPGQAAAEHRMDGEGPVDHIADAVAHRIRQRRNEQVDQKAGCQSRNAPGHNVGGGGGEIQFQAFQQQELDQDPGQDPADDAPDEPALHGQDPGDHPGHNGHIPHAGNLFGGYGGHDYRQGVDHHVEDLFKVGQSRHLAEDQGQGHGNEPGQGSHQDPPDADPGQQAGFFLRPLGGDTPVHGRPVAELPESGQGKHIGNGPGPVGGARSAGHRHHIQAHGLGQGHGRAPGAGGRQFLFRRRFHGPPVGSPGIAAGQDQPVHFPLIDEPGDFFIFQHRFPVHFFQGAPEDHLGFRSVPGPQRRFGIRPGRIHGSFRSDELDGRQFHPGGFDLPDQFSQQGFRILPSQIVQVASAAPQYCHCLCHHQDPLRNRNGPSLGRTVQLLFYFTPLVY